MTQTTRSGLKAGWAATITTGGENTAAEMRSEMDNIADSSFVLSSDDTDGITEGSTNLFFTSAEQTKLSGIAALATIDQTGAQIKTLYEGETNAYTDTKDTKLTGIETGATADQTGAEIKAAYEVQTNAFTDAKNTKLTGIGTGADLVSTNNLSDVTVAATALGNLGGMSTASPQLGGSLDVNGNAIVSLSAGDITITPDTTGEIILDGLKWPQADGTANYVIATDGAGQLSFVENALSSTTVDLFEDVTDYTSGTTTQLTLSVTPGSINNIVITFDGVQQHQGEFSLATNVVTFGSAIPTDTAEVQVTTLSGVAIGVPSNGSVTSTQLDSTFINAYTDATITATDEILFGDVGSSDAVKKDTVQGILDLVPAAAAGLTLLATATASSDATIDFTSFIDSTYDTYVIMFDQVIPATDNSQFYCRLGNGGAFDSGASDYAYAYETQLSWGGPSDGNTATQTYIQISGAAGIGNAVGESCTGIIHIHNASSSLTTLVDFSLVMKDPSARMHRCHGGGERNEAAAHDRVQFYFSSGNVASGEFKLYGVRKV